MAAWFRPEPPPPFLFYPFGRERRLLSPPDLKVKRGSARPKSVRSYHMGSKLYVGNLSYNTTSSELQQMFGPHGSVQSAEVIQDRDTGRSKGFGFVLMGSDTEARAAIAALNGQQQDGRALTVNEAKPREERGGSRGGGGNGKRY